MSLRFLTSLIWIAFPLHCFNSQQKYRYVDYGAMSDQQRGEMLIERVKVHNSRNFIIDDQNYENKDICDWICIQCDGAGNVTEVAWGFHGLTGYMDLSWIPPKTERFLLQGNDVSGTIDSIKLPRVLKALDIDGCTFHGELRFLDLPPTLERLVIPGNNITGMIWITETQRKLHTADLRDNYLENVIGNPKESIEVIRGLTSVVELKEHQQLWVSCASIKNRDALVSRSCDRKVWLMSVFADSEGHIQSIFWSDRSLEGEVPLTALPQFILSVHMNDNSLSGGVDLRSLPASLRILDLSNNSISQKVVEFVPSSGIERIDLRGNTIEKVVSVDGQEVPSIVVRL